MSVRPTVSASLVFALIALRKILIKCMHACTNKGNAFWPDDEMTDNIFALRKYLSCQFYVFSN